MAGGWLRAMIACEVGGFLLSIAILSGCRGILTDSTPTTGPSEPTSSPGSSPGAADSDFVPFPSGDAGGAEGDGPVTAPGGDSGRDHSEEIADVAAPEVEIIGPSDGDVLRGTVVLMAEATDDVAVTEVEFQWDSEPLGPPVTSAPHAFEWNTQAFDDGFYTLRAVARDRAGNEGRSNLVTVEVQNAQEVAPAPPPIPGNGRTHEVPGDFGSIQDAIDAAASGDLVLVAPGAHDGGLVIEGKVVHLASRFVMSADARDVEATVIRGGGPTLVIRGGAAGSTVTGFTFTGGDKGIQAFADAEVRHNRFIDVDSDAMSFERAGGTIAHNHFERSGDDAIDLDGPGDVLIEGNVMIDSGDDGIELRNYDYSGPLLVTTIRGNLIAGSEEDGFQLIDYPDASDRRFILERNIIVSSTDVGIGIMDDGETVEDYRAAPIPEEVFVIHNTLVGNRYGITGGAKLVAVNNIFANCAVAGLKGVGGASIAAHNLFFGNGTDQMGSNIDAASSRFGDPRLTSEYRPGSGSLAIDGAAARYDFGGVTVVDTPAAAMRGSAPDLGRFESGL